MQGWHVRLSLLGSEDETVERLCEAWASLELGGFEHRVDQDILQVWVAPDEDGRAPDATALQTELEDAGLKVASFEPYDYQEVDWSTQWRTHFRAFRFGPLWVGPSWETPPDEPDLRVLRLDPGMAFGTGLHPSTRLCLDRLVELGPKSAILDVGTGSGILALASLKLGTARAVGVDIDPESLRVAAENAAANGLKLPTDLPPADRFGRFPVVVANILAEPLISMASELAPTVEPGGRLILAGLLDRQEASVRAAYEAQGLTFVGAHRDGEWSRLEWACDA